MKILSLIVLFVLFFSLTSGIAAEKAETKTEAYPLTTCIVSGQPLGSMGDIVEYHHNGILVKFCCQGCVGMFKQNPEKYLAILEKAKAAKKAETERDSEDDHGGHNH